MEWLWQLDKTGLRLVNHDWHLPALDAVFRFATYLGLEQVFLPLLFLSMLFPPMRRVAWTAIIAWAVAGLGSVLTKQLVERLRPSNLPDTIVAPDERIFHNSFPSGHTTVAFAVAFALVFALPPAKRWYGFAALALALLVGISRIYRGVHWPTDVLGGICLGLIGALIAARVLPREVSSSQ